MRHQRNVIGILRPAPWIHFPEAYIPQFTTRLTILMCAGLGLEERPALLQEVWKLSGWEMSWLGLSISVTIDYSLKDENRRNGHYFWQNSSFFKTRNPADCRFAPRYIRRRIMLLKTKQKVTEFCNVPRKKCSKNSAKRTKNKNYIVLHVL